MFLGEYQHSVDSKGRLVLPSKFRARLERGLRELLRQAADSERFVILTSDHGHVLDYGTKKVASAKDQHGDRYRTSTELVSDGELEYEG